MEKKKMEYFRIILEKQLKNLLKNADSTVSELIFPKDQEIEYLDRAWAYADQALKLKIRSRESLLIKKILGALERIDSHTFGICDSCGEDIAVKRLEARPVTTKCIECKEKEEKLEKLSG